MRRQLHARTRTHAQTPVTVRGVDEVRYQFPPSHQMGCFSCPLCEGL
ncbi:Uncharacterised protein [Mycobacteroides abscessus subsp. abscessus]|nr:Uncharacterised protein [Mycobacteroides abscessus subsp. abscessus]SLF53663.1 Uncharacterised protein [Mycobacteroides abscessus subsp. massiliense]